MFRQVSIDVFLLLVASLLVHQVVFRLRSGSSCRNGGGPCGFVTSLFWPGRSTALGWLKVLVRLVAGLCFIVLAVTGFYPALILGQSLSGYFLMVHVTAGGAFAACIAFLVLCGASGNCLNRSDWSSPALSVPLCKICFWLLILLALPVFLSVVLSMLTLFGTCGQLLLADVHRYSALFFAAVVIAYCYLVVCCKD